MIWTWTWKLLDNHYIYTSSGYRQLIPLEWLLFLHLPRECWGSVLINSHGRWDEIKSLLGPIMSGWLRSRRHHPPCKSPSLWTSHRSAISLPIRQTAMGSRRALYRLPNGIGKYHDVFNPQRTLTKIIGDFTWELILLISERTSSKAPNI